MPTLKDYFHAEVIGGKERKFSWLKIFKRVTASRRCSYVFWWRIANHLNTKNRTLKSLGKRIQNRLVCKHNTEIMLGTEIGEGLIIGHNIGIVITKNAKIGNNFLVRQNCIIGVDHKSHEKIIIGDNVEMGAGSMIIGSGITIGDNVTIGAMAFINKSIPANSIVYTRQETIIKPKPL